MKKCDIILTTHNAYDYVKRCLETVIAYTDLKENNLIIIDNKSQDERIMPLFENVVNKYKDSNIEIIQNEEDIGFTGSVNKGMRLSKNDVLLLNSDTEVTFNWLKKIKKCAYSKEKVATVTPLSNNATLASVPLSFQSNDIPAGYSLDEYQSLIDKIAYRDYKEIPTGHGFCLYIKREAIEEVGLFDIETYGKGYGEEEDFCYRCFDYGYRHLLCDDVIIYHKESQSALASKLVYREAHIVITRARYPEYKGQSNIWTKNHPLRYINKNINYNLGINNKNKNILILLHECDNKDNTDIISYACELIENLRYKFNFHILSSGKGEYKLHSFWKDGEEELVFIKNEIIYSKNTYYNSTYKKMLDEIIDAFRIDIVHIYQIEGHFFDIKNVICEYKLRCIVSSYDNYRFCRSRNNTDSWEKEWDNLSAIADKIVNIECRESSLSVNAAIYDEYTTRDIPFDIEKIKKIVKKGTRNYYVSDSDNTFEHAELVKIFPKETFGMISNFANENEIAFFCDSITQSGSIIMIAGWMFLLNYEKNNTCTRFFILFGQENVYVIKCMNVERSDVDKAFPQEYNVRLCGINCWFDISDIPCGKYEILLGIKRDEFSQLLIVDTGSVTVDNFIFSKHDLENVVNLSSIISVSSLVFSAISIFCCDSVSRSGRFVMVSGWIYVQNYMKNNNCNRFVVLIGKRDAYIFSVKNVLRTDVNDTLQEKIDIQFCGINTCLDVNDIPSGKYDIAFGIRKNRFSKLQIVNTQKEVEL
jgi:GT2 family glycosyltransferase